MRCDKRRTMAKKSNSVRELAKEADLDLDEALVMLWDIGIDSVLLPDDRIPPRQVTPARRALNVPTSREETNVTYWLKKSGLSRENFTKKLEEVGVKVSPTALRVPKGNLRRLRRMYGTEILAEAEPKPQETIPPLRWEEVGSPSRCMHVTE